MAGFPQSSIGVIWAQKRESSTRHTRKISNALINIPLGNYCLVRQHADASNFFRGRAIVSERNLAT
jgi:hypothetical protein